MFIKDYLATLQTLLTAMPFVTGTSLSFEERPPSAGLTTGCVRFIDGSQLGFKEFLISQPTLHVIKYG